MVTGVTSLSKQVFLCVLHFEFLKFSLNVTFVRLVQVQYLKEPRLFLWVREIYFSFSGLISMLD